MRPVAIACALTACAEGSVSARSGVDTTLSPDSASPDVTVAPLALCLNEFVARNDASWLDETGAAPDWIELHNPSAEEVSLGGWYVTDDPADPFRAPLDPSLVLPPGGFLVLAADGLPELGAGHVDFALSGDGGAVGLFRSDGAGEVLSYGPVQDDFAWARQPDCCAPIGDCTAQTWLGTPGGTNGSAR